MPRWNSPVKTASYKYVLPGEMLKRVKTRRAPGAAYARSTHKFDSKSFTCEEDGHEEPIDRSEAAANIGFDDEASAVRRGMDIILREHEVRVATTCAAQTDHDVSTPWATSATATPKSDVRDAKQSVRRLIGVDPDLFVCPQSVYDDILETTDFKERTKYVNNVEGVPSSLLH